MLELFCFYYARILFLTLLSDWSP